MPALDAQDVCFLNILQKVSREANKHKDDTFVDIVGYVLNAAMCPETGPKPAKPADEVPRMCDTCERAALPHGDEPCRTCANSVEDHIHWTPKVPR
jgi:hypothetical protein